MRVKEEVSKTGVVTLTNTVGMYLREIAPKELLTREEEIHLGELVQKGDKEAEEAMIVSNLRLVVHLAKRYPWSELTLIDLVQEGNIGLITAVKRYDPQKGYRFSTYATWWIKHHIQRAIMEQGRTIRLTSQALERLNKVRRSQQELLQILGREPAEIEIGEDIGLGEEVVREVLRYSKLPISLEMPTGEDGDTFLSDIIEDIEIEAPEDYAVKQELNRKIGEVLSELPEREEKVLRMRYGIGYERIYTLREIGEYIGVTTARIRQIELRALRKIGKPKNKRVLAVFLYQENN